MISKAPLSSVHDFLVYKIESPIPQGTRVFADSSDQELDKLHIQK